MLCGALKNQALLLNENNHAQDRRLVNDWVTTALAMSALLCAYARCKPPRHLLHHSDQVSQYTIRVYRKQLDDYSMQISMSGKGNCYDRSVVERFFGSFKYEWHC